jgi:hypothetical protein
MAVAICMAVFGSDVANSGLDRKEVRNSRSTPSRENVAAELSESLERTRNRDGGTPADGVSGEAEDARDALALSARINVSSVRIEFFIPHLPRQTLGLAISGAPPQAGSEVAPCSLNPRPARCAAAVDMTDLPLTF